MFGRGRSIGVVVFAPKHTLAARLARTLFVKHRLSFEVSTPIRVGAGVSRKQNAASAHGRRDPRRYIRSLLTSNAGV